MFETAATIATPTSITQPAMFIPGFPLLILSLLYTEDHQSDGLGLRRSLPLTYVVQSATRFGNILRCSLSTPRRYPCSPYYAAHRMALVSYLPSSVFHVLCSRWSMLSTVDAPHGPCIPCHALYALCSTVFTLCCSRAWFCKRVKSVSKSESSLEKRSVACRSAPRQSTVFDGSFSMLHMFL